MRVPPHRSQNLLDVAIHEAALGQLSTRRDHFRSDGTLEDLPNLPPVQQRKGGHAVPGRPQQMGRRQDRFVIPKPEHTGAGLGE